MLSPPTTSLLQQLRRRQFGRPETELLNRTGGAALIAELRSAYPHTFQERRIGGKWEVSLARSLRTELAARPISNSTVISYRVVTVYVDCVIVNIEGDAVTGLSRVRRLSARAIRKPSPGLALTTGRGFKLDRTPDGWALKPLAKRTVRLTEAFLTNRGWTFHRLAPFTPTP